jgi:hypothetical protein
LANLLGGLWGRMLARNYVRIYFFSGQYTRFLVYVAGGAPHMCTTFRPSGKHHSVKHKFEFCLRESRKCQVGGASEDTPIGNLGRPICLQVTMDRGLR